MHSIDHYSEAVLFSSDLQRRLIDKQKFHGPTTFSPRLSNNSGEWRRGQCPPVATWSTSTMPLPSANLSPDCPEGGERNVEDPCHSMEENASETLSLSKYHQSRREDHSTE